MRANQADMVDASKNKQLKLQIWNIFSGGLPADYDLETLRKVFILNLLIILGSFFLILLGIIEFILKDYRLGIVDFLFFLLLLYFFIHLRKTKNHHFIGLTGTVIAGIFFSFFIAYGGKGNTAYVWTFTYPLIAIFLLGARKGTYFSLLLLAIACAVFIFGTKVGFLASYDPYLKLRYIPAYVTICLIALVTEKVRDIVRHRLETAKAVIEKNVTELGKANAALVESEEKYRTFFQTSRDCVFITSIDGRVVDFNDVATEFFGYENREEMWQLRMADIYADPKDREEHIRINKLQGFTKEYPVNLKKRDGTIIHTLVTMVPKKDKNGNVMGFQGTIRDISEQQRAEDKLKESEKKYRNILESIEDGYYEVDIAGNLTFFNDSVCKILQYSKNELMNTNNRQFMDAENARRVYKAFNLVYRTGHPYKGFDWELIRKDGSKCYVETSVSLINDPDGRPVGFQGMIRDVSERKKIEEEKIKLEHKLRQAEKMEAIGTLAGGVAHDLNNVLSGIVGYPDLLLLQLPKDSPLRKPISTIQESGLRAAAIVKDLLALARRGIVDHEALNLNTVIYKYLESPEYEKMKSFYPGVEVETTLEAGLLNMMGSPVHISKVLMNLVSNSAEAISEKGKIIIETANRYVDTRINGYENIEQGDYVILTVADSGSGINSEDMKRIFEPFYTKKKMGKSGTGLGLAVVWGTVKDHKGYIDVRSVKGEGTAFTLYFPVTKEELARNKGAFSAEDYMGKGQTILVIDDVKEQREMVSAILTTLGYSVNTTSGGEEAIEYLQNNPVDLLILDMIMEPGMDGLDTYKRILKLHPEQKAIIASGYSETNRVKEAQRLGAGRFIRKPYTLEKIAVAVKKELEE